MALVDFELDEGIAVATMNHGDNRFSPPFLDAFLDVLHKIEQETEANALIVKSAHPKIWSNGFDLDWLEEMDFDPDTVKPFLYQFNDLLKKILIYPMPTIAAVTGHVFAGGAIISCAFDFRFMRSDRGFFCLPEVDIEIPFLPGMMAVCAKAIPQYKFHEMLYTGNRYTAEECLEHHIAARTAHMDNLLDEALAFAKSLNKKRGIVGELKRRMYRDIMRVLDTEDLPFIETGKLRI